LKSTTLAIRNLISLLDMQQACTNHTLCHHPKKSSCYLIRLYPIYKLVGIPA
jgi:hypothetical protein